MDELLLIVGDLDTLAGVSTPLELRPRAPADNIATSLSMTALPVAGSTLRRIMVSSSWRSRVTSTNSSPAADDGVAGGDGLLLMGFSAGVESEPHRRSRLPNPLIYSFNINFPSHPKKKKKKFSTTRTKNSSIWKEESRVGHTCTRMEVEWCHGSDSVRDEGKGQRERNESVTV